MISSSLGQEKCCIGAALRATHEHVGVEVRAEGQWTSATKSPPRCRSGRNLEQKRHRGTARAPHPAGRLHPTWDTTHLEECASYLAVEAIAQYLL